MPEQSLSQETLQLEVVVARLYLTVLCSYCRAVHSFIGFGSCLGPHHWNVCSIHGRPPCCHFPASLCCKPHSWCLLYRYGHHCCTQTMLSLLIALTGCTLTTMHQGFFMICLWHVMCISTAAFGKYLHCIPTSYCCQPLVTASASPP